MRGLPGPAAGDLGVTRPCPVACGAQALDPGLQTDAADEIESAASASAPVAVCRPELQGPRCTCNSAGPGGASCSTGSGVESAMMETAIKENIMLLYIIPFDHITGIMGE